MYCCFAYGIDIQRPPLGPIVILVERQVWSVHRCKVRELADLSLGEIDITKEPTSISPGRNMNVYFCSGDSSIRLPILCKSPWQVQDDLFVLDNVSPLRRKDTQQATLHYGTHEQDLDIPRCQTC